MSSLGIAQIRSWQPSVLASAASAVQTASGQLDGVASSVGGRLSGSGWEGISAAGAEERASAEAKTGRALADALSSAGPVLHSGAASIGEARDHLLRVVAHAEAAGMTVSDTGAVKAPAAHVAATSQESSAGAAGEARRQGRLKTAQAALNAKAKAFAEQITSALETVAALDAALAAALASIEIPTSLAAGVTAYLGGGSPQGATGAVAPTGSDPGYCPPSAPAGYQYNPTAAAATAAALARARLLSANEPDLASFIDRARQLASRSSDAVPEGVKSGVALGLGGKKIYGLSQKDAAVLRFMQHSRASAAAEGTPALMSYLKAGEKYEDLRHGAPDGGLVGKIPKVGGPIGRAFGRSFVPLTIVTGGIDAVTGGGHDGARGATTRVLGAGAVVGAGAIAVAAAPEVVVAGTVAVTAYGVWSVGTTVYDHADEIGDAVDYVGGKIGHGMSDFARNLAGAGRLGG